MNFGFLISIVCFICRMTLGEGRKTYLDKLAPIYGPGEANAITRLVFEEVLQADFSKLAFDRFRLLTREQEDILLRILLRLVNREPVQQVLQVAYFAGKRFIVNRHTLIPRPETEELVYRIDEDFKDAKGILKVLDIGTGSGCIAIALQLLHPHWEVEGVDVSPEALHVAEANNNRLQARVRFGKLDILKQELPLNTFDIIVSNPPYIGVDEATTLEAHVLNFEPHLALFAPEDDVLAFYRVISEKAFKALKTGGRLYFEINSAKGPEVEGIMRYYGFSEVKTIQDLSGLPRIVTGIKPA